MTVNKSNWLKDLVTVSFLVMAGIMLYFELQGNEAREAAFISRMDAVESQCESLGKLAQDSKDVAVDAQNLAASTTKAFNEHLAPRECLRAPLFLRGLEKTPSGATMETWVPVYVEVKDGSIHVNMRRNEKTKQYQVEH